jgi:hypothetical protein
MLSILHHDRERPRGTSAVRWDDEVHAFVNDLERHLFLHPVVVEAALIGCNTTFA